MTKPIGIFDSGVGGLTVLKEIRRLLPNESLIYFGDTAHAPYGGKDAETLIARGREITEFFLKHDTKMVIMACGTSSSTSYDRLCAEFPHLPITDTIRPAAAETVRLALQTPDFRPVLIATQATINSGLFAAEYNAGCKSKMPHIPSKPAQSNLPELPKLHLRACPMFAPIAEAGFVGGHPVACFAAKNYLADLRGKVNALILGCTHYPLLKPALAKVLGEITFIDPAEACARAARDAAKNLPPPDTPPEIRYCTSGDPEKFSKLARIILNEKIVCEKIASFK
ncbi:MAG: aspartate/glutamate racemase family protein [Defluviitaleaceae bacterium]|nr:aspartate/glutamate racemase family protein [Defluviitaleaceae bacterium]